MMATAADALALAVRHHEAGDLPQAERLCRLVLQAEPANADALHLLGVLAHQAGRPDLAAGYVRRAVALAPGRADFRSNLGLIAQAFGRPADAAACFREALRLRPDFADAHFNLGVLLQGQGHPAAAEACLREALRLRPGDAETHCTLGTALQDQGRAAEAEACYREALRLHPGYAEAHCNLGTALQEQGRPAAAEACYREALRLRADYPEAHCDLGTVLQGRGQIQAAEACYREAVRLRPGCPAGHSNLGVILRDQGRVDEAAACFREALRLRPDHPDAHGNLGNLLKDVGRLDEALAAFRRCLEFRPGSAAAHSNLLYALHYHPAATHEGLGEEHGRWNERHAEPLAAGVRPHANDPTPDRRLRVGYLSPDLRAHPVGRFLLPVLEAHDRTQVEVCCYSSSAAATDDLTRSLRGHADLWRDVAGHTDERLAEVVREDGVDVLVDLAAHMANNRLLVFARRPAPVQVTYLAYCSTTGLRAIDYRLTDPHLDPPGRQGASYSEESVWLPETYWCYRAPVEAPPVAPTPALAAGRVTFGCLNNYCKATPPALDAWRALLRAVPGSRLLLHAQPGAHRQRAHAFFADGGVDPGRVEFVGFSPLADYFRLYDRIDVGLDPFPYCGGTTTCDALWMGVPVVSLAGATAVSRAGLSILTNAGLPELVARTPDEYVGIAAALAGDLPRLAALRSGLRERLLRSPLTDAPRFARHLEAAFRRMWHRWCLGPRVEGRGGPAVMASRAAAG